MGRHVVSVQWRKVWFFPGNFGLFNRDPISRSTRPAGFELRQRPPPHPFLLRPSFPHNSHASRSSLYTSGSSLFRFRSPPAWTCACALHSIITSHRIRSARCSSISPDFVFVVIPRSPTKLPLPFAVAQGVRLSFELVTALNIAFCPTSFIALHLTKQELTEDIFIYESINPLANVVVRCVCVCRYWNQRVCTNRKLCMLASRAIFI